ncbi:hypothetical protein ISCGN_032995, partial [Ixodes scapularis]
PEDLMEVDAPAIFPGSGWGSSSDNSLTQAVTIKTEPPEYVEQDKEPNSHLVSVKSEPPDPTEVHSKAVSTETDVQGDSDTQESESILPDDGPGWGSSSDNSLTQAVTVKTEPPDYVEQDEEPSSHLVSVKSEPPEFVEQDEEPSSHL